LQPEISAESRYPEDDMPTLPLKMLPEVFLEHRGYRVFHAYRRDEYPERYTHVFTLSVDDEDTEWRWQFDVRELPGADDDPADIPGLIRAAIDRCLDQGDQLPFSQGADSLPSRDIATPVQDEPSDWGLLDFLAGVRGRSAPLSQSLEDRHIAGAVHLITLLANLDASEQQLLEQWLRRRHTNP
jgi:hypothetical protein